MKSARPLLALAFVLVLPAPGHLSSLHAQATPEGSQSLPSGASETQLLDDLKVAKALLAESAEAYRVYGSLEVDEYRQPKAKFNALLRKHAAAFPELDMRGRRGTNHFVEVMFNRRGAGLDAFRFRSPASEPMQFGWIFAFEQPSNMRSWFIVPPEGVAMRGFTEIYGPKLQYTNAPWSGLGRPADPTLQWLHADQIQPGKEYIIWFRFTDARPARCFVAFDLFPVSPDRRSRSVLESAFGLEGVPIPGPR